MPPDQFAIPCTPYQILVYHFILGILTLFRTYPRPHMVTNRSWLRLIALLVIQWLRLYLIGMLIQFWHSSILDLASFTNSMLIVELKASSIARHQHITLKLMGWLNARLGLSNQCSVKCALRTYQRNGIYSWTRPFSTSISETTPLLVSLLFI